MCKCFIPYAHAKSIYDIPVDFFKSLNISKILIDLDNTLDSYKLYTPSPRAVLLIQTFIDNNIEPIIISNNKGKRVASYANALNIRYINSARKPFPHKIKCFIKENGLRNEDVLFVGDQIMTDTIATHYAKINMILTEKIVNEDQWTTHINRIFDRPIRKYFFRKGKIKEWSDIYGRH